jgi:ubiquinol-cytochrome c reductase iron-sulfur subunit
VSRLRDWLLAGGLLALGRGQPSPEEEPEPDRRSPGAEALVHLLLLLASLCSIAFVVVFVVDSIPAQTQFLGLSLGLALVFIASALVLLGLRLVPDEEHDEEYAPPERPEEQQLVLEHLEEGGSRLSRAGLMKLALAGTGGALAVALVTPVFSLGRFLDTTVYRVTPWRRGKRLVDEEGRPWRASDIEERDFYTAFPEGADRESFGSPLVIVRLPRNELRLPPSLRGYDAQGIVAYSKICTHAGCAVAMYRTPLFQPAAPRPALVCPCHYSTFDPATGGTVIFGPAGRPLPMLPIEIDRQGFLRAKGTFDGQVGPSWWGVRVWGPKT